jgi:hypothetical protein
MTPGNYPGKGLLGTTQALKNNLGLIETERQTPKSSALKDSNSSPHELVFSSLNNHLGMQKQ